MLDRAIVEEFIKSDRVKDLHIHSYFSDGMLSPEEIVKRWKNDGVEIIAITDHDEIEGSMVGCIAARELGLDFIPGIEFDSQDMGCRDLHILGYGVRYDSDALHRTLSKLKLMRAKRNDRLLKAINNLGYNITLDDIGEINGGRFVGKPTFARVLVNKGVIEKIGDAFDGIFRNNESIRSIKKEALPSKEIVDTIHDAGGIAVLAHPIEQKHRGEDFETFRPRMYEILDKFVSYGIDGIECYHPSASDVQAELLVRYAEEHDLLITRGSDFHGDDVKRDYTRYHE